MKKIKLFIQLYRQARKDRLTFEKEIKDSQIKTFNPWPVIETIVSAAIIISLFTVARYFLGKEYFLDALIYIVILIAGTVLGGWLERNKS